jgi:phage-related protein
MGDGVFELRIQQGSDDSRIFYFFYVGSKIVLTNGFIKKTQKTPLPELARAKQYKDDYERRYHG